MKNHKNEVARNKVLKRMANGEQIRGMRFPIEMEAKSEYLAMVINVFSDINIFGNRAYDFMSSIVDVEETASEKLNRYCYNKGFGIRENKELTSLWVENEKSKVKESICFRRLFVETEDEFLERVLHDLLVHGIVFMK